MCEEKLVKLVDVVKRSKTWKEEEKERGSKKVCGGEGGEEEREGGGRGLKEGGDVEKNSENRLVRLEWLEKKKRRFGRKNTCVVR